MGRVKLKIKRLESTSNRQVTYSKRRNGILKKARELSILCDIDIVLLMFSPTGRSTLFHGHRSNIEEVIARFAQLTPQERAKRKLESLEALKKTFKKLDHDVNIQDFLGASTQTVEELTHQVRILQAQLTEVHQRLSYWSNPGNIESIEHLRQMENSLRESINQICLHKENFGKQQLMSLEFAGQSGMHLPLTMNGMQENQSLSWLPNNDNQHMLVPNDPSFLPQRDMGCSEDAHISSYSGFLGAGKEIEVGNSGQAENMEHGGGNLNELSNSACISLQLGEQYSYPPYSSLNLPSDDKKLNGAIVPYSDEAKKPVVYPLRLGLKPPISRLGISWSRGNSLRVTVFRQPSEDSENEVGGKAVDVRLDGRDGEISDAQWRRIAYGSVSPFALLQSRKNSFASLSKISSTASPFDAEWWEYVLEYSKDISSLLGNQTWTTQSLIEDPKEVLKKDPEPSSLKAAWELMESFYADKLSQAWLPERLVDWLADYDSLFSSTQETVHSKLVDFQKDLVSLQVIEDEPKYWEVMSSALAVGWLDIVVKLLRLHGSYQLDQLGNRETENGLVEAVAVLISKMPRMRPELEAGKLGECFKAKPDFMKAWEKWRAQIAKLECSTFWVQCAHRQTQEGLRNMLQIMLGNTNNLCTLMCHWMELYIAHFLYIRPFTVGLESMYGLAQKCIRLKPMAASHRLMGLLIGILGENIEVVLAECSKGFGPWMVTHAIEVLTAGSHQADTLLHEERDNLGGISMEELHRLVYAQVLSSHPLTWQIAPIYLTSCIKQGMGLLEILLYKQPVDHNQLLLKNLEICRLYELDSVSSNIMKIAGMYNWKHGKKGSGVYWLQQARDEARLNRIAQQMFDSVGRSISDESFRQWEGLIQLLGSEPKTAGGLEFLHKYRDFKKSLLQIRDGKTTDAARQAVESLISLMKNPSTPQRFWLPLLHDSLKLLNWEERPLLNVLQTNLLLNKLQELSIARLRPDFIEADLPPHALSSVRLALATNLGRATLEEQ